MKYLSTIPVIATFLVCCSKPIPIEKGPQDTPASLFLSTMITRPVSVSHCPTDMVEVEGKYCTQLEAKCLRWLDPNNRGVNGPAQCAEFEYPTVCKGKEIPMHFCIDRYEGPANKPGVLPEVNRSWIESKNDCEALGKRLCRQSEWVLSCEGPERKPYPYGYVRDSSACNIDKPWRDPTRWVDPVTHRVIKPAPFSTLDQRVPSGSMPRCVSDYGVHDQTGNVDEWVVNESGRPYRSGMMGGHWAQGARNRCRPMTDAHNETFTFYESGSRCCSDPK